MSKRADFFEKCSNFKLAILLYQTSLERKNFVKLKRTQLFQLAIKLTKPFALPKACTRRKLKREASVSYFFVQIITLMLLRICGEALSDRTC